MSHVIGSGEVLAAAILIYFAIEGATWLLRRRHKTPARDPDVPMWHDD